MRLCCDIFNQGVNDRHVQVGIEDNVTVTHDFQKQKRATHIRTAHRVHSCT